MTTSHISTHILDNSTGQPARDVEVQLFAQHEDAWERLATGKTDHDGRIGNLGPERLPAGTYRLSFATGTYFARMQVATFFPRVDLIFKLSNVDQHYHVPLLLSPFAYSTYRGS